MRAEKKIDDQVRLKILDALLEKGSVVPNLRQIQRKTKLHKATIKSSIDFLLKEGLLSGFGPKINIERFGYKLETIAMFQADLSQKELFDRLVKKMQSDPYVFRLEAIIGSGNWNLMARYIHKDVESYHKNEQENYYEAIPNIFKVIRDKQIFYATEPYYKTSSRTKTIINLIKKERGYD